MTPTDKDSKTLAAKFGKELEAQFENQLPSALFSKYEIEEFEKRLWAVYFKPSEWREIISRIAALEQDDAHLKDFIHQVEALPRFWNSDFTHETVELRKVLALLAAPKPTTERKAE